MAAATPTAPQNPPHATAAVSCSQPVDVEEEGLISRESRRKRKRQRSGKRIAFLELLMSGVMAQQKEILQRLDAIEKREQDLEQQQQQQQHSVPRRPAYARNSPWLASDAAHRGKLPLTDPTPNRNLILNPNPRAPDYCILEKSEEEEEEDIVKEVLNVDDDDCETTMQPHGKNRAQASCSSWPKAEVDALIKLRTALDSRFLASKRTEPKDHLWEEISDGMQQLGYSKSAEKCKAKWKNVDCYYKKLKRRNKKCKSCCYFARLDAFYRSNPSSKPNLNPSTVTTTSPSQLQPNYGGSVAGASNGGSASAFLELSWTGITSTTTARLGAGSSPSGEM